MPEPSLPPTPIASTDLAAQERRPSKPLESGFNLPPPAMPGHEQKSPPDSSSVDSSSSTSASSYRPVSPISPAVRPQSTISRHKRTASGAKKSVKDDFSLLPPPPTRARKIIQMQPKSLSTNPGSSASSSIKSSSTAYPPSKRKTPSASSVAGRKIARRTAHSIIERRRRSKMNEEFDTLKNMIPACEGQEMHKLAILQASIEYTRYLEDCIKDLSGQKSSSGQRGSSANSHSAMTEDIRRPMLATSLASPNMDAQQFVRRSTADSTDPPSVASSASGSKTETTTSSASTSVAATPTLLSPAFNAIHFSPDLTRRHASSATQSATTSPAILPQAAMEIDQDHHDATAALLMLTNDRRGLGKRSMEDDGAGLVEGEVPKRRPAGMSVKDLLST